MRATDHQFTNLPDRPNPANPTAARGRTALPVRRVVLVIGALANPAFAAEPSGCDKFKWPIDRERAVLMSEPLRVESGASTAQIPGKPIRVALRPAAEAGLPTLPERTPKADVPSFAGFVRLGAVPTPGTYAISLSAAAWLDAIQDGKPLRPVAFSGATDCDGIRKVVILELRDAPLLLQVSGVGMDSIILAITPSP